MALIETIPVKEDYRRKMALKLMQEGTDASPVQHWAQGLARLGQGALGGYEMHLADQKDKETEAGNNAALIAALGGVQSPATAAPAAAPQPAPQRPTAAPAPVNPAMQGNVPAALSGPRPGGPVMPSAKVWGDKEAEDAGLYEKPAKVAALSPMAPAAAPAAAPVSPPAPSAPQMSDARRALAIKMLSSDNKQMRTVGANIAQALIGEQFKSQDYDIHHRPDGSIIAVNKKNPAEVRTISGDGGRGVIQFEAEKAGAVEEAKRKGAVDFEAGKAGAVKRAELEAAKAVAKPEQDKQNLKVADIVTQDIDRSLETIKNSTLPTTGAVGNLFAYVGGTGAHDLNKLLDTVKSNAGFQELSKMRQASPTGAALGSITERELALLQSTIGNLEQSQSREQLEDNLRRVKNTYLDIIHGEGKGPARETLNFKQNKTAPPSIDDLVKKYAK